MSGLKDTLNEQDPDYVSSVPNNEIQQKALEENARANTARKITAIIEKEFSIEIETKEKEVLQIQSRLHKALKLLHLLRYVIVTDFYNRKQCQLPDVPESKQTRIHPAVKGLIGKSPKCLQSNFINAAVPSTSKDPRFLNTEIPSSSWICKDHSKESNNRTKQTADESNAQKNLKRSVSNTSSNKEPPKKIPRYVPPKSAGPEPSSPSRGVHHKVRKRIIVGNTSKWIPPEWREDDPSSHKWTMYVLSFKKEIDISEFVEKVRFFLHPSYQPHDVVEITSPPFYLSRRGWGEFPLRVQLHFKNSLNKPMDIIHHLKLDRTYTGLQIKGSETVLDIWIHTTDLRVPSVLNTSSDTPDESCQNDSIDQSNNSIINHTVEPAETVSKENEINTVNSTNEKIEMADILKTYIRYEHDYARTESTIDNNKTIIHLLNGTLEQSNSMQDQKTNGVPQINGLQNKMTEKELAVIQKTSEKPHGMTNNAQKQCMQKMVVSFSKCPSKMQPLQISIPQNFETSKKKQILILKNNKLLPVNSVNLSLLKNNSVVDKNLVTDSLENNKKSVNKSNSKPIVISPLNTFLFNAKCNVPALQIMPSCAESQNSQKNGYGGVSENCAEDKETISKMKVIVGKEKQKVLNKKSIYEDIMKSIGNVQITDTVNFVKYIIHRLPLITLKASDPEYKRLHPYSCSSETEFFQYNIGKQKAYEWYRAKAVRSLMKQNNIPEEEMWTIKEIIIWARRHGYTPMTSYLGTQKSSNKEIATKMPCQAGAVSFTCTEPAKLKEWLQQCDEADGETQSDVEIDIESVSQVTFFNGNRNLNTDDSPEFNATGFLEIPEELEPLYTFVTENIREIGLKLGSESIIPGITHCAAARVMMQSVRCLVDNLVRLSFAQAIERSSNDKNDNENLPTIILDDVRGALTMREEFEIFTNAGLGCKQKNSVQEALE